MKYDFHFSYMHEIKYVLCTTMVCADSRKSQHREHVNFYEIQVHSWSDLISIPTFWNRFASFHCFNKWFIYISHSRSEQFLKQNTICLHTYMVFFLFIFPGWFFCHRVTRRLHIYASRPGKWLFEVESLKPPIRWWNLA